MAETVEPVVAEHVSAVADVRDVPLTELASQLRDQKSDPLARILDLDARGLLTAAAFNAVI